MKITINHGKKQAVAVGEHCCRLLQFAFKYPGWHTFKNDRTTKRAVKSLQTRTLIEVVGDQFRFNYNHN